MQAVIDSKDGIIVAKASAPDYPVVFVNPAFERLTGYTQEEILNRSCRFLQADDNKQKDINVVQNSLRNGEHCSVTLRNYRKDGTMFWNELSISPVFNRSNTLTHFIGIQRDVTSQIVLEKRLIKERKNLEYINQKLEHLVLHDNLTGIYSRKYFDDQLNQHWNQSLDAQKLISIIFIDVDYFKGFNDAYGHMAGDVALKTIATALHDLLEGSGEFVARFGGEEFVVLTNLGTKNQVISKAKKLCTKIRNLNIPHEGSPHGFLTISCGISSIYPKCSNRPQDLLQDADMALYQAKGLGRNQVAFMSLDKEAPGILTFR